MTVSSSSIIEAMVVTLSTALLLCGLGLMSLLEASKVVEVGLGGEATLECYNYTNKPSEIHWFRLVEKTQTLRLASLFSPDEPASYPANVEKDKYKLWSNTSTLFLQISSVKTSDAGLYFCGYLHTSKHPVLVDTAYLIVEDECAVKKKLVALTAVTGFMAVAVLILAMVVLADKVRKPKAANQEEPHQDASENICSDDMTYVPMNFKRRKMSVGRMEPNPLSIPTRT